MKKNVKKLIKNFATNLIRYPEGLFNLKLNKYEEGTKKKIIGKVEKFVDDYVKGKQMFWLMREMKKIEKWIYKFRKKDDLVFNFFTIIGFFKETGNFFKDS